MKQLDKIPLQLSPQWIADYCHGMRRSTSSVEKRLAALDSLQTFIRTVIETVYLDNEVYKQIVAILASSIEEARVELTESGVRRLSRAFEQHKVIDVAVLFNSMSRSGFWEILTQTVNQMEQNVSEDCSLWAQSWLSEARSRGEKASPYPDAIDFEAAGINIGEYTAMTDVCKYMDQVR